MSVAPLLPVDRRLEPPLPPLPIEPDWKALPRLWGHPLHRMSSYLGAFPPVLPHALIDRWSRPGDVVLDPFCGRGTAPLQACVTGRVGIGIDRNPLAALITRAKVDLPDRHRLESRLAHLRIDRSRSRASWDRLAEGAARAPGSALVPGPASRSHQLGPLPPLVARMLHPRTLADVLFLRASLDARDPTDAFLLASLAGILHGRSPGYLTPALPNGFSPAMGYAERYLDARGFRPPERDALALLAARVQRLLRAGRPRARGVAFEADAREGLLGVGAALRERSLPERVRLVVTSPPYLGVVRYGAANRERLWLLGHDAETVDRELWGFTRPDDQGQALREVLDALAPLLSDDAVVVLVLGDVATDRGRTLPAPAGLARHAWEHAARPSGYLAVGIADDDVRKERKLTRLWGSESGRATSVDRLLVLAPTELGRRRALAALGRPVDWASGLGGPAPILRGHAADVPPGRPRLHGPARAHEEPRPRAHDESSVELRPPAAGAPLRP